MSFCFSVQGASKIIFGCGERDSLPREIKLLGKEKPFIVIDPYLWESPYQEAIAANLDKNGFSSIWFKEFEAEPEFSSADKACEVLKKEGCDIVIGIGGGSTLDLAKAVSVLVKNEGSAQDYMGLELVPNPGLPKIMLPSTAGTGSEVTFTAVFTDRKNKKKGGINSRFLYPEVAIVDPEFTYSMPPYIASTTGIDALTHAIEAYTSKSSSPLSDLYAAEAIQIIGDNIRDSVLRESKEARNNMSYASLLAGLALASAGVGAVHAMAYPLGAMYGIPHGLANAVMLPYVVEYNIPANMKKYNMVSTLIEVETHHSIIEAYILPDKLRDLLEDLGIPHTLKELDISRDDLEKMAEMAMTVTRPMENNPRRLTREEVMALYEIAYEGLE